MCVCVCVCVVQVERAWMIVGLMVVGDIIIIIIMALVPRLHPSIHD